ncbi:MAG: CRISPR-associated helicase Cas3' [Caldisericum sp.]|uniref:CRISPR-associated helicase Cas3' n=1 Tax=Caldisericum sp. TaxID=2499687 RepID=UPI003D13CAD1
MSSSLNQSGLFSHPGRALEDHLLNVAELTYQIVGDSISSESPYTPYEKSIISDVSYILGLLHDFGKATDYFQNYLKGERVDKSKTRHSFLSSIVSFGVVNAYLNSTNKDINPTLKNFLKILSYIVVANHHSDLDDFLNELSVNPIDSEFEDLLQSINEVKLAILVSNLKNGSINSFKGFLSKISFSKEEILNFYKSFKKVRHGLKSEFRKITNSTDINISYYFLANLMFSALIGSDKEDAVLRRQFNLPYTTFSDSIIKSYKEKLPRSNLSLLRESAFEEVEKNFLELLKGNNLSHLFYITLPTGLGKTLIGFNIANILRNHLNKNQSKTFRIIYSLPFINIIEQNAMVFESVLKGELNNNITTDILLKHHHLSELSYTTEEDKYDVDASEILIENWESNIIITTFVQLFHTLISNRNSMLKKFHKLAHSIIIIDEVQAVPLKYWKLIDELLLKFLEEFNSYAIVMTATKPILFSSGYDLVRNVYPLNRYKIDAKTYYSYDSMEDFINTFKIEDDKSYMFVLNTISEAKQFYEILKEKVGETEITFLSSHITPKERLERIEKIKSNKFRFLVSTQIVEAGVDIDFDVVVRDIAPLDSIIQSSGRSNRSGGRDIGEVYVVKFKDKSNSANRLYASYIYDRVLLDITENLLKDRILKEEDVYKVFDNYMEEVVKKKDTEGTSNELRKALLELKYDGENAISSFGIVETKYPTIDVFIELDEDAEEIFKEYQSILDIQNHFERIKRFKEIKNSFYSYVVSIPKNVQNIPPVIGNFYYVSRNSLDEYYDKNTGFKTEGGSVIW